MERLCRMPHIVIKAFHAIKSCLELFICLYHITYNTSFVTFEAHSTQGNTDGWLLD